MRTFRAFMPALLGAIIALAVCDDAVAQAVDTQHGTSLDACGRILRFIETGFGALLASAAGIGAIISAAVGSYRPMWALLVVSIGSFILRAYLTLFHSPCP